MKCLPFVALLIWGYLAQAADGPKSFGYILQADSTFRPKDEAVKALANCGRDWIVLDAVYSSKDPWTQEDLDAIRQGKTGRKIVAYISIGEAEDYRPYWNKEWIEKGQASPLAPAWLGRENPEWKGNFMVKYWHPEWQEIMLPAITEAMERGFDGVYLDLVDAFQTWEFDGNDWIDRRPNPETKQSYRDDMVQWVKAIARRAREVNREALIIPQNGSELLENGEFLSVVSAIGLEDLFSLGDQEQTSYHTRTVLKHLEVMKAAGKPILLIEYPEEASRQARSRRLAQEHGFIWLITDRKLKTLGVSGE